MSGFVLPSIEDLPFLPEEERDEVLNMLFEPSADLRALSVDMLAESSFESYHDMISSIGHQLTYLSESDDSTDIQWLDRILGAHPRLGDKKVDSAQSQQEQAQLNVGTEDEINRLRFLNYRYETKFPGLKYVVFVNGRGRPEIMQNMKDRIDRGNIKLERAENIKAMCAIAADRVKKLGKA